MIQDLRFGFRMLRRTPGFTLLAILCLTLGIGANAAVFSWIEGVLFRPFDLVPEQDRLVAVASTNRGTPGTDDYSWPDFLDLQRSSASSTLFEAFIAEKITGTTLSIGDKAERAPGSIVSANYFDAIGVTPILGRGFLPDEESGRNAHPVTVISYQMWQQRFQGDPAVRGKTQIFNGVSFTIVGVAPQGFYATFVGYAFQSWVPASMQPTFDAGVYKLEDRGARWIEGFARLKPNVTIEQAQAEVSAIAKRLEEEYPETNRGRGISIFPLWRTPFNNARTLLPTLTVSLVVVLSVLLIACANVGNLLLVRAFARQQEMTVRLALGAERWRLVRQLLTEGVILTTCAAACGLLVANWLRNVLPLIVPPHSGIILRLPGDIDWRVLALSAGLCVISTLLFGLVPAMLTSRIDLAGALRCESGGVVGARGRAWVRSTLVLIQMSLSFVLLVGAGLLVKSVWQIQQASPGFSTCEILTTGVDLFTAGYDTQRAQIFQDALIDRLQTVSGVQSGAFSRLTPFSYQNSSSGSIAVEGYAAPPDQQPTAEYNEIGPGYLATMGIPLLSGREFSPLDHGRSLPVAVVDETMAAEFWRDTNPVGRRLQVNGRWLQVVGVARAVKYHNLFETTKPFFYVPLRQQPSRVVALQIRTTQSPAAFARTLINGVHALDANLMPGRVITMREQIEITTGEQRVAVTILVVFGGLALLLATIGLYGVMASTAAQSTRELALRTALGAGASDLLRLVLSKGLTLTIAGMILGGTAALQTTRLMGYLLYRVSPRDPSAFALAIVVMALASLVACIVPAWRAARTDPFGALRG